MALRFIQLVGSFNSKKIIFDQCKTYGLAQSNSSKYFILKCFSSLVQTSHDESIVKDRKVPSDTDSFINSLNLKPDSPPNARLLKVALVGVSNSGKSTLTNALMKAPICDVSNKVHTTLHTTSAHFVKDNAQVIFLDTPGLVTIGECKKYSLEPNLVMDPLRSIKSADLLMVVIDLENKLQRFELPYIVGKVLKENSSKNSILVLNKIDKIKEKRQLLEFVHNLTKGKVEEYSHVKYRNPLKSKNVPDIENIIKKTDQKLKLCLKTEKNEPTEDKTDSEITSWPYFSNVFMVSALENDGIKELQEYLISQAIPGEWRHHSSILTTTKPTTLAKMIVRSQMLTHLYKNIPYELQFNITSWKFSSSNVLEIFMDIICPRESHIKFVVGSNGDRLRIVTDSSRKKLISLFKCPVDLNLYVKCNKLKK